MKTNVATAKISATALNAPIRRRNFSQPTSKSRRSVAPPFAFFAARPFADKLDAPYSFVDSPKFNAGTPSNQLSSINRPSK